MVSFQVKISGFLYPSITLYPKILVMGEVDKNLSSIIKSVHGIFMAFKMAWSQ